MGIKINKEGLSRWVFTIINSAMMGGVVALGGLAAMFKVAPSDFNFLSTYNWGIVLQGGAFLFFFGFIGSLAAALLKSPLHYDDVFVVTLDKGTETTITIVKDEKISSVPVVTQKPSGASDSLA